MKYRGSTLLTLLVLFSMIIVGCEEEKIVEVETPSEKQARLIAIENAQLKEKIKELNSTMQRQIRKYEGKIKQLDKSLESSQKINTELQNLLQDESNWKQFNEFMATISETLEAENERLRKENENFESQIEQLKERVAELEATL